MFIHNWWALVLYVLLRGHISTLSVTLYLHRSSTHSSVKLHPAIAHFFRFVKWFTTGTIEKEWVAVHRKHHRKVEEPDDPHSPVQLGIARVFFDGVRLYNRAAADLETLRIYGRGTPDDWIEKNIYTRYSGIGLVLMFVLDIVLAGWWGIATWAAQILWMPLFAAGVINGIGHWWGYRNFDTPDNSHNIPLPAMNLFAGGEQWHNNHHKDLGSPKFSARWWEFDITWLYIKVLEAVRLAKPRPVEW